MRRSLRFARLLLVAPLLAALGACDDEPGGPTLQAVTSGTISGIPFTVTGGTIYQAGADGPLYADDTGGQLLFDQGAAGLGTSDPDLLHLRTQFALSEGGSLHLSAFGDAGSALNTGAAVGLIRGAPGVFYELRFRGALFADGTFSVSADFAGAEHWVAAELYADSVPGHGADQAGASVWPLDDLDPAPNEDVLGCDEGPAIDADPLTGEAVGYALDGAWLLAVEVVDEIVGPCV